MNSLKFVQVKKLDTNTFGEDQTVSHKKISHNTESTNNIKFPVLKNVKSSTKAYKSMEESAFSKPAIQKEPFIGMLKKQKLQKKNPKETGLQLVSRLDTDVDSSVSKSSTNFVCKYCCRRFFSIELLRDHSSSHGNTPTYVCYLCGHEAGAFSSLMSHFVKHSRAKSLKLTKNTKTDNREDPSQCSPTKVPICCNQCKVSFPSTFKLASHHCSTFEEKCEFNCAYCGQISASVEEYRLHVLSHSVTPFFCMHCNFKGPTKKLLDKHNETCKKRPKKEVKNTAYKCTVCNLECKHKKELNYHMKHCKKTSVNITDVSNCVLDNKCFEEKPDARPVDTRDESVPDAINKDSNEEDSLLCSLCGEIFDTQAEREDHRNECPEELDVINDKEFILCTVCGEMFPSTVINKHITTCGLSAEQKKKGCESDSDSPSKRRSARLVTRKVSFSEEVPIIKEEKIHRKRRKLSESRNGSKPKVKKMTRRGRQSKLGKDNFKCIYCDLTFCSKSTLLRHKRMHSGNPYYSCMFCGKFFFRKDVYTRHESNVHKNGTDNFCCFYCKQYFYEASVLKEHVLASHIADSFLPVKQENIDKQETMLVIKKEPTSDGLENRQESIANNTAIVESPSTKLKGSDNSIQLLETLIDDTKHNKPLIQQVKNLTKLSQKTDNQISERNLENAEVSFVSPASRKRCKLQKRSVKSCVPSSLDTVVNVAVDSNESNNLSKKLCFEDEIQTGLEKVHKYFCKLCSKQFINQSLLTSHEQNEEHIVVDWYKCLVCNISGPKKDMIDHMFTHMYCVGTVVVSSNSKSLGSFLTSFESLNTTNKNISKPTINDVPMDELDSCVLPPLADYGLSSYNNATVMSILTADPTTVSEVIKNKSKEKLKDLKVEPNKNNFLHISSSKVIEGSSIEGKPDNYLEIQSSKIAFESRENLLENNGNKFDNSSVITSSLLQSQNQNILHETEFYVNSTNLNIESQSSSQNQIQMEKTISSQSELAVNVESTVKKPSINKMLILERKTPKKHKKLPMYLKTQTINSDNSLKVLSEGQLVENIATNQCNSNATEQKISVQPCIPTTNKLGNFVSNAENTKDMTKEVASSSSVHQQQTTLNRSQTGLGNETLQNCLEESNSTFSHLRFLLEDKIPEVTEKTSFYQTTEPQRHFPVEKPSQKENFPQLLSLLKNVATGDFPENKGNGNSFSIPQDILGEQLNYEPQTKIGEQSSMKKLAFKHTSSTLINIDELDNSSKQTTQHEPISTENIPDMNNERHNELNQNINTYLKFDINQCRGEFSEDLSLSTAQRSPEKLEQATDIFQSSPMQSKILDFSDLLIGDSINPIEDNIFQYKPLDTTYDLPSTIDCNLSSGSTKHSSLKCSSCDQKFLDPIELSQHNRSKSTSHVNCIDFDPKGIFLPSPSKLSTSSTSATHEALSSNTHASNSSFSSNKAFMHQDPIGTSFPSNMCQKCCMTFSDSSECARHFLNCPVPFWHRNNDSLKPSEMLQSLLAVRDPGTSNQQNFSLPSNSDSVLNLSKNPFNS